jgi:hypothetical protein
MKVWKMVKNRLPFFGTLPFLRISPGSMRTSASSGNAEKCVVRLIGENIAVGEEQDARTADWSLPVFQSVPAAVKQLPGNLESDERFAGAGGQRQQDALLPAGDGLPARVRRRCPDSSGLDA